MRNMLHGGKPFRLVSLMLALALALSAAPFAAAGAERDDIDFNDMSFAHWGMAMTARMIANAVDHRAEIGPARYKGWCSVPLMRPDKVFVLQLTSEQFSAARETLGDAAKIRGVASALAEFINRQFVGSYADAAVLVAAERSGSTVLKGPAAIVMVYGPDLVICTWNSNTLDSAFVISSESVSAAMDADAIRKSTADIGIVDPEIRAYEGEALDRLLTLDPEVHGESPSLHMWGLGEESSAVIADIAAESTEHMRAILPLIARDDRMQEETILESLYRYVNNHDEMETAAVMAREFLPMVSEDVQREYLDFNEPITDKELKKHAAPAVEWVEDNGIREDATFLFVIEKQYPDGETITGYDLHLQAALPEAAIPATPEEADYIIRTVATWDGDKYTQGEYEVIYCNMHTAVYDAKTGVKVKDFGTVVHKLSGFMSVSSRITYMSVSRLMIWDQVKGLFK